MRFFLKTLLAFKDPPVSWLESVLSTRLLMSERSENSTAEFAERVASLQETRDIILKFAVAACPKFDPDEE